VSRQLTRRSRSAAILLWSCIALFAARTIGQFEVMLLAPAWLPPMDAWYSGLMPYYLLLPAQVALLMIMTAVACNRRVRTGRFAAANPRAARALRFAAYVYLGVMTIRLGVNVFAHGAEFWREGAIPVAFHWVLALFLLVSARASEFRPGAWIPAGDEYEDEESDDIPHGDIPALPQPLNHGLRLREQVGYRNAS
jgi:hypothetical protein